MDLKKKQMKTARMRRDDDRKIERSRRNEAQGWKTANRRERRKEEREK